MMAEMQRRQAQYLVHAIGSAVGQEQLRFLVTQHIILRRPRHHLLNPQSTSNYDIVACFSHGSIENEQRLYASTALAARGYVKASYGGMCAYFTSSGMITGGFVMSQTYSLLQKQR